MARKKISLIKENYVSTKEGKVKCPINSTDEEIYLPVVNASNNLAVKNEFNESEIIAIINKALEEETPLLGFSTNELEDFFNIGHDEFFSLEKFIGYIEDAPFERFHKGIIFYREDKEKKAVFLYKIWRAYMLIVELYTESYKLASKKQISAVLRDEVIKNFFEVNNIHEMTKYGFSDWCIERFQCKEPFAWIDLISENVIENLMNKEDDTYVNMMIKHIRKMLS